jgi:hypothetical protein
LRFVYFFLLLPVITNLPNTFFPFKPGGGSFNSLTVGGGESGNNMNYLLAQKALLERQNSAQNLVPYWSGDALSAGQAHNKDINAEASILHSKLLPPMSDPPRQSLQSQNPDLLAMLHSKEKPQQPTGNSGLPLWPNYPDARNPNMHSVDLSKGTLNTHQNLQNSQNIGIGAQQHSLMQQNWSALSNLPPEKMLSEISQDPQLLNVLQQQYLMSQLQLQSQPPLTPQPQLSMLDKMLLLKQQQQLQQQLQLEQQQKVLLQQQQQQLQQQLQLEQQQKVLAHMVPQGDPSHQPEDSDGSRHPSVTSGDSLNHGLRRMQEGIEVDRKLPLHSMQVGQQSNQSIVNMRNMDAIGLSQISSTALPLPHEIAMGSLSQEGFSRPQMQELFANDTNNELSANHQEVKSHEMGTGTKKALTSEKILYSTSTNVSGGASKDFAQPPVNPKSDNLLSNISKQVKEIKLSSEDARDDVKVADPQETKKAEKKKKQKKKQAAANAGQGTSKTMSAQQSRQETEADNSDLGGTKHHLPDDTEELFWGSPIRGENDVLPPKSLSGEYNTNKAESESDPYAVANQRGWKPTQGFRPKSLLEIQAEEQLRAQRALAMEGAKPAVPAASAPSIPWNGMVTSSELHLGGASKSLGGMESAAERNKRSQLHDLLAEEVLARSSIADNENISSASDAFFPPLLSAAAQPNAPALDDNDFIEAKDKKSKKKATKAKGYTAKAPSPVGSFDPSAIAMPTEKGKSAKQAQQDLEILPAPPSGPSFGDFVPWKSDATSVPAPAWSKDSARVQKPLSLRDIQREEERRLGAVKQQAPSPTPAKLSVNQQAPLPTPAKLSMNQKVHGNASGSSPSKTVAPVLTSSNTPSRSKSSAEDDLFWGPSENSKQDKQQYVLQGPFKLNRLLFVLFCGYDCFCP